MLPIKSAGLRNLRETEQEGEFGFMTPETHWTIGSRQDALISHQFLRRYASWTIDFDLMTYAFTKAK